MARPARLISIAATIIAVACTPPSIAGGDPASEQRARSSGGPAKEPFDFEGGRRFPKAAGIAIADIEIPPGSGTAHVPIILDKDPANTIVARVRTRNGTGADKAYSGRHFEQVDRHVIFRPGDPLRQTVAVPVRGLRDGQQFQLTFPAAVHGARVVDRSGAIRVRSGVPRPGPETDGFRAPRRFAPEATPDYSLDPRNARWTARGDAESWATRLPHGRTQPANGESGLYLDPGLHPSARPSIEASGGTVVLRSQSLDEPIAHDGRLWRHGAAVLSAEKLRKAHLRFGKLEWVARMPNREGSWPALWLLPRRGWPPEIDVYEGFGYSPDWEASTDISANIHGGAGGKRRFTRLMRLDGKAVYDIEGLDTGFHRYAVDIRPDTITWFIDGKETYQVLNPFAGTMWFPLMTVAVKQEGEYGDGSGEMEIRSFKLWRD